MSKERALVFNKKRQKRDAVRAAGGGGAFGAVELYNPKSVHRHEIIAFLGNQLMEGGSLETVR